MKSCYAGGGTGLARPGKGVAEKLQSNQKNGPGWRDAIIAEGSEKTRKIKTERPRELESSIRGFYFRGKHVYEPSPEWLRPLPGPLPEIHILPWGTMGNGPDFPRRKFEDARPQPA